MEVVNKETNGLEEENQSIKTKAVGDEACRYVGSVNSEAESQKTVEESQPPSGTQSQTSNTGDGEESIQKSETPNVTFNANEGYDSSYPVTNKPEQNGDRVDDDIQRKVKQPAVEESVEPDDIQRKVKQPAVEESVEPVDPISFSNGKGLNYGENLTEIQSENVMPEQAGKSKTEDNSPVTTHIHKLEQDINDDSGETRAERKQIIQDDANLTEQNELRNESSYTEASEKPSIDKKDEGGGDNVQVIESNISVSEQEMKEPEEDEWLDILGNGLLKKKVIKEGKGRETRPVTGQLVTLKIVAKLEDGTCVENHDELSFILGDEDVIQAMDLAVALMELEEEAELYTDAKYAYGSFGRLDWEPPIPPNSSITFDLQLLSVAEGPNKETMPDEDRTREGEKKRSRGNDLYTRGDYSAAINCYRRAIKYLEGSSDKEVISIKIKCWNNMSAAQLKIKAYKAALQSCQNVLNMEPDNVKALFRKGKCLDGTGETEEALTCMKKASMLDPQNKMILLELGKLRTRVANSQKKEKEMCQRMIQGFNKDSGTDKGGSGKGMSWSVILGAVVVAFGGIVAGLLWTQKH